MHEPLNYHEISIVPDRLGRRFNTTIDRADSLPAMGWIDYSEKRDIEDAVNQLVRAELQRCVKAARPVS